MRRNREALKPAPQQTNLAEETTSATEDQTATYAPTSMETADSPKEDATSPNKPMRTTTTVPSKYPTTKTRVVKLPTKFNDFVMT